MGVCINCIDNNINDVYLNKINNSSIIQEESLDASESRMNQINKKIIKSKIKKENNEIMDSINSSKLTGLKIDLYPENIPQGHLEKAPFKDIISNDV